jgi:serine/threonine-protein kinase
MGTGPQIPLVDAGLGAYPKAIAAARQQVDRNRNDTLVLALSTTVLAQVLAQSGDRDAAIALIPQLLEMPAGITPTLLTLDPMWDPLRDDPRFVELTRRPLAEFKVTP